MAKNYGVNGLGTKQNLKYQGLLQTDPDAAARYLSSMQAQNSKTGIIPSVTQTATTQQKTDANALAGNQTGAQTQTSYGIGDIRLGPKQREHYLKLKATDPAAAEAYKQRMLQQNTLNPNQNQIRQDRMTPPPPGGGGQQDGVTPPPPGGDGAQQDPEDSRDHYGWGQMSDDDFWLSVRDHYAVLTPEQQAQRKQIADTQGEWESRKWAAEQLGIADYDPATATLTPTQMAVHAKLLSEGRNRAAARYLRVANARNAADPNWRPTAPTPEPTPDATPDPTPEPTPEEDKIQEDNLSRLLPGLDAMLPENWQGSDAYQWQKQQGLDTLERQMAARGLAGSQAEMGETRDFIGQLGATEAEKARDLAWRNADRYWEILQDATDRKEAMSNEQFNRLYQMFSLMAGMGQNAFNKSVDLTALTGEQRTQLAAQIAQYMAQLQGSSGGGGGGGGGGGDESGGDYVPPPAGTSDVDLIRTILEATSDIEDADWLNSILGAL